MSDAEYIPHRINDGRRVGVTILFLVALCGGIALVYAPGIQSPFYLDDNQFLARKPIIRTLSGAWQFIPTRRFCALTFAVDYHFHGVSAMWFRVTNIAIHAVAGCVLFDLIRRSLELRGTPAFLATRATGIAAFVAAAWTLHPLQTGAVTYVVQRFESLMGCAMLVALYALLRAATTQRSWPWHLLGALAVGVGCQSKEIMAVYPVVAIAYDRAFLAASWRELAFRRGWLHLFHLAAALWMVYSFRSAFDPANAFSAGFGVRSVSPWEYLRSQPGVLLHYLKLCFWPDTLCLDYQWRIARSAWAIYPQGLVILGLLGTTAWLVVRVPRMGFLGVCFFAILAPTSSVMPIADLAFEHRMYLPLAPVLLTATLGVLALFHFLSPLINQGRQPASRYLLAIIATVVVLAIALRTAIRNVDYASPYRMWRSVIAVSPWNYRAHHQLALHYQRGGMVAEAEHHFAETLRYRPDAWWVDIGLGNLRVHQNRLEEAEALFRKALAIEAGRALATSNLARLYEQRGDWLQAVHYYGESLKANPVNIEVLLSKARAHQKAGQMPQAVKAYEEVLRMDPRSQEARGAIRKLTRDKRPS